MALLKKPEWGGAFSLFDPRFLLTPVTVNWCTYEHAGRRMEWKLLYVFGVRIARWRTDA